MDTSATASQFFYKLFPNTTTSYPRKIRTNSFSFRTPYPHNQTILKEEVTVLTWRIQPFRRGRNQTEQTPSSFTWRMIKMITEEEVRPQESLRRGSWAGSAVFWCDSYSIYLLEVRQPRRRRQGHLRRWSRKIWRNLSRRRLPAVRVTRLTRITTKPLPIVLSSLTNRRRIKSASMKAEFPMQMRWYEIILNMMI